VCLLWVAGGSKAVPSSKSSGLFGDDLFSDDLDGDLFAPKSSGNTLAPGGGSHSSMA